jgi:hypothetical protein
MEEELMEPGKYASGFTALKDSDGTIYPLSSLKTHQGVVELRDIQAKAVQEVAKADPSNIQEVAASQLAIINSYYQGGLQQSQRSFHWSLVWGGVGFSLFVVAVGVLLLRQSLSVALTSGIAGAIVEVFAGIYLYLYNHASDQLAVFRTSLESTQRLLLANSMCERLEGDLEQTTRAELIRLMVSSAVNIQAIPPTSEETKV